MSPFYLVIILYLYRESSSRCLGLLSYTIVVLFLGTCLAFIPFSFATINEKHIQLIESISQTLTISSFNIEASLYSNDEFFSSFSSKRTSNLHGFELPFLTYDNINALSILLRTSLITKTESLIFSLSAHVCIMSPGNVCVSEIEAIVLDKNELSSSNTLSLIKLLPSNLLTDDRFFLLKYRYSYTFIVFLL